MERGWRRATGEAAGLTVAAWHRRGDKGGLWQRTVVGDEGDNALQHGGATRRVRRLELEKGID
jgi:hypothetical protein